MITFRKQAFCSHVLDGGRLIGFVEFIRPGRYYATTPMGFNAPTQNLKRKGEAVDYLIRTSRRVVYSVLSPE